MSKVISFSISDKYLEKLRTLYPALTDNLAAKQFLTDGLESSLGNSLDVSLDDGLDGKLKSLIESWVDGLLDERLDATVGKLLTSLSDRLTRLEERLDDSLDGRLDDMERLLRLQQSASIASPIPTDETVRPAIETVTPEVSPSPPDAIGTLPTVEIGSTISTIEPVTSAIATVRGDSDSIEPVTGEGMNAAEAYRYLTSKGVKVSEKTLSNWISKIKHIPMTDKGDKVSEYLILRDGLYFPNPD